MIIVFSTLFLSSATQNFPLTKTIGVSEYENQTEGTYVAYITDGNSQVSKIYARVNSAPYAGAHQILIQIPYGQVELDSVKFTFSSDPNTIISFYVKSSSYIWTEINPHEENSAYVYEVKDLGSYGRYTVNFEFLVETNQNTNHLAISTDLSMHKPAMLQMTSLKAHAFLDAPLPRYMGQATT